MFNKETEYALRGLVYIKLQNLKNRRPGTAEIAKEIEAPPFYTAKILQRIVRVGLLESLKGKGGGFFFDENKPDLPLVKLITATEGDKSFSGCGFGLKHCNENNPCPLHEKYAPIRYSINKLVSEETVQSLAEKVYKKELSLTEIPK
ncbi:MAG: Rrf2 family transcriptional regulator [Bacteroidales bacterium]|nr:Rrf2 family transcriptional regulator [Bacteroidales bacterium]MBK7625704.1 Rrf2 family transcriptional regulator [Bacteroidales bacterium]